MLQCFKNTKKEEMKERKKEKEGRKKWIEKGKSNRKRVNFCIVYFKKISVIFSLLTNFKKLNLIK